MSQALEASYSRRVQRERRRLKAKDSDDKGGTDDNEKDSGGQQQHNNDSSENLVEEDRELSDLDKMSEELTDLGGNVDNDPELLSMLSEIDNSGAKTSSNDSSPSRKTSPFSRLGDDVMDLCDRFFLENQVGRRLLGIDEMYIETRGLGEASIVHACKYKSFLYLLAHVSYHRTFSSCCPTGPARLCE